MKFLVIFLCAARSSASSPSLLQPAKRPASRCQPSGFTSQDTNSSDTTIGSASGIAVAGDTCLSRTPTVWAPARAIPGMLFSNLSSQLPAHAELQYNDKCPVCVGQASVVLGQPDFVTPPRTTPHAKQSSEPQRIASDGVHLVVADTDANRILIWNHIHQQRFRMPTWSLDRRISSARTAGRYAQRANLRGPEVSGCRTATLRGRHQNNGS